MIEWTVYITFRKYSVVYKVLFQILYNLIITCEIDQASIMNPLYRSVHM